MSPREAMYCTFVHWCDCTPYASGCAQVADIVRSRDFSKVFANFFLYLQIIIKGILHFISLSFSFKPDLEPWNVLRMYGVHLSSPLQSMDVGARLGNKNIYPLDIFTHT